MTESAPDHVTSPPGGDGRPWPTIEQEILGLGTTAVRDRYLNEFHALTGRNVIAYYSGFLHAPPDPSIQQLTAINDLDKNGFMACIHGMDRSLGLDLILHTPGGDLAATESLIEYLWQMFDPSSIRTIVPQMAMSGGTIIALATNEIVMGKHSSIGPIDPQFGGISAHNVVAEFEQAKQEIANLPALAGLWGPILQRYGPTLVKQCKHAIEWADELADRCLRECMFSQLGPSDQDAAVAKILNALGTPESSKAHNRHIGVEAARDLGLNVVLLEDHQDLQDAVLPVHHAFMISLSADRVVKLVQNQKGAVIAHQL